MPKYDEKSQEILVSLLVRVADRDEDALQAIYHRTSPKLFAICARICADRGGAEDVLQDIFVTVWERAETFDPMRASPITWLSTIARNRAIDWRRAHARQSRSTSGDEPLFNIDEPSVLDLMIEGDDRRRLHDCLEMLEPRVAYAIRSAYLHGNSYAELATIAAIPVASIKSRVRRGLQRLRTCLEDE